jgi:hypothetical protein
VQRIWKNPLYERSLSESCSSNDRYHLVEILNLKEVGNFVRRAQRYDTFRASAYSDQGLLSYSEFR